MKFNQINVLIGQNVRLGHNVKIGDHTTIYDNVIIGDNTIISNNCVIGEPLNAYYRDCGYEQPETVIGSNSLIRSHTIIYAGSRFGEGFQTGHRVTIREQTIVGKHCVIGTNCDIQGIVTMGDYCRLHSGIFVGQTARLGDFVWIFPGVTFTEDPTPPSNVAIGPVVESYAAIGARAILLSGTVVGEGAVVAAGALVNRHVEPYTVVKGVPAKFHCAVQAVASREKPGHSHYPWMYNFERGMPWAGIGFEAWLAQTTEQD